MRIPQQVRDCVVYLYDENNALRGTGFVVGVPDEAAVGQAFPYVITAAHVVKPHSKINVRYNSKSGMAESRDTSPALDWWASETLGADVACAHFCPPDLAVSMIRPDQIADDAFLIEEDIGPGDEVVFSGLFIRTPGKSRNLPVNRFGQIARMNEETVPQKLDNGDVEERDAILVEGRSWGGHSGSPAFIVFPMTRYMGQLRGVGDSPRDNWALLGLVLGHWDLPSPIRLANQIGDDKEREAMVNSGIALVGPGQHILDLVNRPDVVEHRKDMREQEPGRHAATADAGIPDHEHGPFNRPDPAAAT